MPPPAPQLLLPAWPAPAAVRACTSTRQGGVSVPPYDSFNLAAHAGDAPDAVRQNRARLRAHLELPCEPHWLNQVHGTRVVEAEPDGAPLQADGAVARAAGAVCAVLTADCLPVLLCDRAGSAVAALHAGWRGLLDGIVAAGIRALGIEPGELLAWIGPGISQAHYQVGAELRERFLRRVPAASPAFLPDGARFRFDLALCCRQELLAQGVRNIYDCGRCTYGEPALFYSYRRQPVTGRMATLIWLAQ